ncbi:bifunctional PIG-L family deacetylase/class I SAM-dependent methyltransferase [Herbiconiux sp.]|uniref:bifunctional PIG-L family deacetylase/class I SAM-dependent methyltransferase n=1 Tax=Herbiconiux sp. TaxID=1871186 RepID=UPI0025C5BB47|nr:bifunctional PIG-L family deacetylase/class I SAM-dependent methyltransferase [Herbiconiux sp.]
MSFQHDETGVDESMWRDAFAARREALPELDAAWLAGIAHLVVVAAHPDDETLGAAGLLSRAYRAGVRSSVIVATSGEASHPDSSTHTPEELGRLREEECLAAVAEVDPGAAVTFLRLPDGHLDESMRRAELGEAIVQLLLSSAPDTRSVVVSPWVGDRHPDHAAAAGAAQEAAGRARAEGREVEVLATPIWLWFWAEPGDARVPWTRMRILPLDADAVAAKGAALARHVSQVQPLSGLPGDEVLLHPGMIAHFERDFEAFVGEEPDAPDDDGADDELARYFETLHADADDPWGFETRWYEQRKRAVLLASLPARDYASVLEVGCSTGVLTLDLAARVRHGGSVLGVDLSAHAVERAQARLSAHPEATAERMRVPDEWPDGRFDLVVISEIGYYLDPAELTAVVERVLGSLTDDGAVVLCHWRHPVEGRSETGDSVHAAVRARPEFGTVAQHLEEDFVLDVFERAPVQSVARREGIV